MKHSQASSTKPVSKAANPRPEIAGTVPRKPGYDLRDIVVKSYLHDNILDLSKASDFFQREAEVAEALGDYVERLPAAKYKLKNGFETFFHRSLPIFLSGIPLKPADALADSLFRIAQAWANGLYVDSLPGDWRCTRSEALTNEWKKSWKCMEEEHWNAFREMSSPSAQYITTALDEKGNVDHELCYVPTANHVEVGVSFAQDPQQSPEMRILIKGGPAVSFMIAYIRKSQGKVWPRDKRAELENLRVIFESTVSTVAKEFLGLTRPSKGRPRDVGEMAAYRLYHERKPARLVSRELCSLRQESNHLCDSKCFDKMKKAAANHFKHLRREILSLVKSSKKKFQ
jgi:hypothetical protein